MDEARVGHGKTAKMQGVILTPRTDDQKTKGSRSCLLFQQVPVFIPIRLEPRREDKPQTVL
jgi:hypothetical protein